MHDPLTLAFEIPNPFARHYDPAARKRGDLFAGAWSRRDPLVTIWHKDPWKGSEDSCDWHGFHGAWRWDERCEAVARDMASWDGTQHGMRLFAHPAFPRVVDLPTTFEPDAPKYPATFPEVTAGDALALTLAAFNQIAWQLDRRILRGRLLERVIAFGLGDETRRMFAPTTDPEQRLRIMRILVGRYLQMLRPWWRHPRFHFWHWRVVVHPWRDLRRWLQKKHATIRRRAYMDPAE